MDNFVDMLRPYLSRVIAGLVGSLAAYLETKFQIVITPDTKAALIGGAMATYSLVYSISHRTLDKKLNPGDAASSHLATAEKAETQQLKSTNYTE